MTKFVSKTLGLSLLAAVASIGSWQTPNKEIKAASTCENYVEQHGQFDFWSSFGTGYSDILDGIVKQIQKDDSTIKVRNHAQKGSYDRIKSDMMNCIQVGDYPNVCVGYPDHFAEYIGNDILVPLDGYIERYKQSTGIDLIKDEYYEAYMTENKQLDIDCNGDAVISGVPFNKSTELLGYNGVFVDYCVDWCLKNPDVEVEGVKASEWDLGTIPETWQDWAVKGNYYRHIMNTLTLKTKKNGEVIRVGKVVYGDQDYEGTASNFEVIEVAKDVPVSKEEEYNGKRMLLDFHQVEESMSRIISWDATDNMFITLLRQWGSEYTVLPEEEKLEEPFYRKGHILFNNNKNREKTIECLKYFTDLNIKGIFGVPQTFDASYSSEAFSANQVMFMCCSSGGLSYNCSEWRNRFRVAHLPYYKGVENGETVVRKYVISQGANLAMTDKGSCDDVFKFIVKLTTGEYQLDWCLKTGYYPASKTVANSPAYQEFLYEDQKTGDGYPQKAYLDDMGNPAGTRVSYREGSRVNEEYYMPPQNGKTSHFNDDGEPWHKFVDDAFVHSSDIRLAVKSIFVNAFALNEADSKENSSYQSLLDDVCKQFNSDSNIIVEDFASSKGCFGSIDAACGMLTFLSAVGVGLIFAKKNKGEMHE